MVGESGKGKTTYAKEICRKRGLSFFISSGSNDILDGYSSQDAIILDDLRPSCMGLSDLLKLLDNNTASSVKSRYRNKFLECSLVIITTTKPIDAFFNSVFENENETVVQLKRRCKTHIRFAGDSIFVSLYDTVLREYGNEVQCINTVLNQYTPVPITEADLTKAVDDLGLTRRSDWHDLSDPDDLPFD